MKYNVKVDAPQTQSSSEPLTGYLMICDYNTSSFEMPEVATLSLIVTGHMITRPGLESENNANHAFMYVWDG